VYRPDPALGSRVERVDPGHVPGVRRQREVVYNTTILMPRFFSVVHKGGFIGDWHRGEIFPSVALFIVLLEHVPVQSHIACVGEIVGSFASGETTQ
jgi:hypothetical protein